MLKFCIRNESLKTWDAPNWIWLGGSDAAAEGVWEWTDGSSVSILRGKVTNNNINICKSRLHGEIITLSRKIRKVINDIYWLKLE